MQPSPQSVTLQLAPGTTVGKYEILRKLATGGMAEIYLARVRGNAGFEKLVVLKRILPHIALDPSFMNMFLDEARLAATLQHPNIADVYDFGEAEGSPFFTMEYIHGQDIRSIRLTCRKRNEPVPLAIALGIIHGVASALDYAHDKRGSDGKPLNLVHRDISASNVLVSYDGAIKLVDFGIARATNRTHKTQVGTLKGKVPYMSPEQCRGWALDRRSDLFSLGIVLFELTIGKRPYRGDNDFAIMDALVNSPAPKPSSIIANYPGELEDIVLKLLARDPDHRYQNVEELLHDLDAYMASNKLWVSSKPLGKFMRMVFADRIAAWENAQKDGQSFGQHLATTVTSQSQQSELVTPPSVFPALPLVQEVPNLLTGPFATVGPDGVRVTPVSGVSIPKLLTPSNGIPIPVRPSSPSVPIPEAPIDRNAKTAVLAGFTSPLEPEATSEEAPIAARPRKRLLYIAASAVVVLGAITVILASSRGGNQAAVADPVHETQPTPATRPPAKPETKPVDTKPAETKPAETKPAETTPAEPERPAEPTKATTKLKKPNGKKPDGKKPDDKNDKKPDDKKPDDKKPDPPKETPWDPDSPTLPD